MCQWRKLWLTVIHVVFPKKNLEVFHRSRLTEAELEELERKETEVSLHIELTSCRWVKLLLLLMGLLFEWSNVVVLLVNSWNIETARLRGEKNMASLNLQPPKRRSLTNLHLSSCKELFLLVVVFVFVFIPKLDYNYICLSFHSSGSCLLFVGICQSIKMLLVCVQ